MKNTIIWKNDFYALRHGRSIANEQQLIVSRPPLAVQEYGLSEVGMAQAAAVRIPPTPAKNTNPAAGGDAGVVEEEEQDRPVILITSDFRRAVETAEIVQRTIVASATKKDKDEEEEEEEAAEGPHRYRTRQVRLHYDVRLRERDFGRYDLTSDANYHIVWANDDDAAATAAGPPATETDDNDDGVESVESVWRRGHACMEEWNDVYDNCYIVLVAHGDVLQILQTSFFVGGTTPDDEEGGGTPLAPHQHRSLPHLETAVPRLLVRRGQLRRDEKVEDDKSFKE
jgi:glucosyl-3-phosphoglycerate phosphatase